MARPLRIQVVEGWYHVTARGSDRRDIFSREEHYAHFLDLLQEWVPRFRLCLHADPRNKGQVFIFIHILS